MQGGLRSRMDHSEVICIDTSWGVKIEVLKTFYRAQRFSRHFHDTFTIGLGLQGTGRIWYRGGNHSRDARDVVIIPPGELHTGGVCPRASCVSYMALYLPLGVFGACAEVEGFNAIEANDYGAPVIRDAAAARALRSLHDLLWPIDSEKERRSAQPDVASAEDVIHLIVASLLRRDSTTASHPREPPAAIEQHGLASRIREILEDCYSDRIRTSLRAVAQCVGVSPFHVVRTFTRATGLSPHQYLIQLRVNAARQLLAGGQPPSLIAAMVGFVDQSHLTVHFKRFTGITPSHYQRSISRH